MFIIAIFYPHLLETDEVISIEFVLIILLALDILMRMFADKNNFFLNLWNIIDLLGTIFIIILFGLFYMMEMHKGIDT